MTSDSVPKLLCLRFVILVITSGGDNIAAKKYVKEETRDYDYCDIYCNGTQHTMCKYPAGGGEQCANNLKVYLTAAEKRYIEDNLNRIRDLVANGQNGLPQASNMMKLVWDRELSTIAKRWADQCDHPKHDECRVTQGETETGQTVYFGRYHQGSFASKTEIKMARIKEAMEVWKAEKKLFNMDWLKSYNSSTEDTAGNFTQIIWGTTEFVGCGYTEFNEEKKVVSRFVCNFKRRGNIDFKALYREGEPCTKCPSRAVCSETYVGMCWNQRKSDYTETDDATCLFPSSVTALMIFCMTSLLFLLKDG